MEIRKLRRFHVNTPSLPLAAFERSKNLVLGENLVFSLALENSDWRVWKAPSGIS